MGKIKIKVSANMTEAQAKNALQKIEKEKNRLTAVSKAFKAKDGLSKLK